MNILILCCNRISHVWNARGITLMEGNTHTHCLLQPMKNAERTNRSIKKKKIYNRIIKGILHVGNVSVYSVQNTLLDTRLQWTHKTQSPCTPNAWIYVESNGILRTTTTIFEHVKHDKARKKRNPLYTITPRKLQRILRVKYQTIQIESYNTGISVKHCYTQQHKLSWYIFVHLINTTQRPMTCR